MAVRIGGQTPGNLGPPFRKRNIRHNASQGFRQDAPFDVRTGHDVPLVFDPKDQVAILGVLEVRKDYLICEGLNPYTEKWMERVAVAKPYLLQVTPFDGKSIELEDGSIISYQYDPDEGYSTRVVTTTDTNGNLVSEITETLSREYFLQDEDEMFVKDLVYAIRTTVLSEDGSQAIDNTGLLERNDNGDPIDHEGTIIPASKGYPIEWLDLNAGARSFVGPSLVGFFPIELLNSDGEAGDAETQCSWKYHIRLPGGNSILQANVDIIVDPHEYRRPALGAMKKATAGIARYDEDDELSVYWTNEVPEVSTCGEPDPPPIVTITIPSA